MEDGTFSRAGEPCFMVTQDSACRIGFQDDFYEKQPLAVDHSELVKFSSQADDSYGRVLNRLRTPVSDAQALRT
jgi:hypothetical protein